MRDSFLQDIGLCSPYVENIGGATRLLVEVRVAESLGLSVAQISDILSRRSGVQVFALEHPKKGMCWLASTARNFSEAAIEDLLRDLELLLGQRATLLKRADNPRIRSRRRDGAYLNDPRGLRRVK